MTRTPPNNHHTNDSIDFLNEDEEIRFLKAELQHARTRFSPESVSRCSAASVRNSGIFAPTMAMNAAPWRVALAVGEFERMGKT